MREVGANPLDKQKLIKKQKKKNKKVSKRVSQVSYIANQQNSQAI
jgi:hypothetical protein